MTLEDRVRDARPVGALAYLELAKPGITLFVVLTAVAGYLLAALPLPLPEAAFANMLHLALGVALCSAGALALNQYLERGPDSLMRRTRLRPIPSGRIRPRRAAAFGVLLTAAGLGHLWFWLGWLPALVTGSSALLYDAVYTPLKLRTALATPVGAVPGALPVLIGWTAHASAVDVRGFALFAILVLWQLVHVLALGWSLREDYERAGLRLIPSGPPSLIGGMMLGCATALLALSLTPALLGMAGPLYLGGALMLGCAMVGCAAAFLRNPTRRSCRNVFVGSLIYHPLLLGAMVAGAL